ncbi:hypothetical protein [Halosimplex halobium]|uniref:hypothetical protein n=1 Tax=Halosimplex halobium TaxID=3396618 RepID=UPI003F54C987
MSDSTSDDATAQGDDQPTDDRARSADGGGAVGQASDRDGPGTGGSEDGRDIVGYVQWAAFAILCLLALVATFRFYFAASEAIRVWFSPDFVPVFQAVFNLVVLAASAIGISVLVRRIA